MNNKDKIKDLKQKLNDLDAEWERLDSLGTQTEKQRELADKMVRIRKQIEKLSSS